MENGAKAMATLSDVANDLCKPSSLNGVIWRNGGERLPSVKELGEIMAMLRAAIFPGYFGAALEPDSLHCHLAAHLDTIYRRLSAQIVAGLCFDCPDLAWPCSGCAREGADAALTFMKKLPHIRELLAGDAQAAYEGDPAATSPGEAIFCYPSITAMFHHRVAHELYLLKLPLISRIIAEMAHSATGIDIHPGARIGRDFFIDHGTGVVIGETCVIGRGCRLYQGVTLGALSFPKNTDGTLIKGNARHPVLEDNVTVYAGATILGRVTIGRGAVIGGNVWITENVPPGTRVTQSQRTL